MSKKKNVKSAKSKNLILSVGINEDDSATVYACEDPNTGILFGALSITAFFHQVVALALENNYNIDFEADYLKELFDQILELNDIGEKYLLTMRPVLDQMKREMIIDELL